MSYSFFGAYIIIRNSISVMSSVQEPQQGPGPVLRRQGPLLAPSRTGHDADYCKHSSSTNTAARTLCLQYCSLWCLTKRMFFTYWCSPSTTHSPLACRGLVSSSSVFGHISMSLQSNDKPTWGNRKQLYLKSFRLNATTKKKKRNGI